MGIEGKVVAITGVSGGIGRTLAEVFAERGALVVGCARSADKGRKLEERIRAGGGVCTFVEADVTRQSDCYRFIDAAVDKHGRIDVLINNAGGSEKWFPTDEVPEAEFDAVVKLNLDGPLFCSQRAIQHMKRQGQGGAILSVASVNAVLTSAMAAAYNSAKAALIALSNTMAIEFLEDGIRSNIILMGGAPTAAAAGAVREMTRVLKGEGVEPDWNQYLPKPLTGTPLRDIAAATAALASDDCKAITGATIAIDQGQSIGALHSQATFLALSGRWPAPQP
jgi:NAD(P)-dependent dehydrogenase (short-subunit alcohol dehydrogenase family)